MQGLKAPTRGQIKYAQPWGYHQFAERSSKSAKGNIGRANGLSKKQNRVFAANPYDRYNLSGDNSIVTVKSVTTANH